MKIDIINTDFQELTVIAGQMIQLQVKQDDQQAYIDLSKNEVRKLIGVLESVIELK